VSKRASQSGYARAIVSQEPSTWSEAGLYETYELQSLLRSHMAFVQGSKESTKGFIYDAEWLECKNLIIEAYTREIFFVPTNA
jgi:hypothetical protein